jgi:hypothetical protein
VDDRVKELLKELGEAISRAVSESPDVEYVMQTLRDSGHEAKLILEAIIAVQNSGDGEEKLNASIQTLFGQDLIDDSSGGDLDGDPDGNLDGYEDGGRPTDQQTEVRRTRGDSLTPEDRRFLKYLKIEY